MVAAQVESPVESPVETRPPDKEPVLAWLRDVLQELSGEFAACRAREPASDAELIDQIAVLEQIGAAAAALKAAKIVRFDQAQIAAQHAEDWDPADVGRGIAEQIGLACHVSPTEGSRRLSRARAWWWDLPATRRDGPRANLGVVGYPGGHRDTPPRP